MRKLKFKGKALKDYPEYDIKEGDWIVGYLARTGNRTGIVIQNIVDALLGMQPVIEVDEKTVGQYTEVKDDKDQEIYEGDLIKFNDTSMEPGFERPFKGFVVFIQGCFYIKSEWGLHQLNSVDIDYKEVIGNIHDKKGGESDD
jgi:uncharacterized phage protein (TIGR01671 family)